jgi:hypothetical protein
LNITQNVLLIKKKKESAKIFLENWEGKGKHSLLCEAYFYNGQWSAENCGVEREGANLDEVAVEIYCNTV